MSTNDKPEGKKRHNIFVYEGAFKMAKEMADKEHRSVAKQVEYLIEQAYKGK